MLLSQTNYHTCYLRAQLTLAARSCDAMDDRPRKLQRLNDFKRSVPHVTGRALSAILARIQTEGLPELISRRDQQIARDTIAYSSTPYGPLRRSLQLRGTDGGTVPMELVNPLSMIYHACAQGGPFADMMLTKLQEAPPSQHSPWKIVLYSDGITPGDAFRTGNERKLEAVYWSFLQFGASILCHEDSWFTMISKRSTDVERVSANMSQIMGTCAKQFFTAPHDLRSGGMMLSFQDGTNVMMFAELAIIIQDGLAHKQTWCASGASGTRSCMKCLDYVEAKSDLTRFDSSKYLRNEVLDPYLLQMHTDDSIRLVVRRLQASSVTDAPGLFKLRQQALGFTHEPDNLLLDDALRTIIRPISQHMHDWMHVMMAGVFQLVVYLTLEEVRTDVRDIYSQLDGYLQVWKWPRRMGGSTPSVKHVFDERPETSSRDKQAAKMYASQGLAVYPVLAHFLRKALPHVGGGTAAAINVYLAMVVVLELLQNVPRGGVTPPNLRNAICRFMTLYVDRYGNNAISKLHGMGHLVDELRRHGTLLSCWVHERKHKTLKRYAQDIMSGSSYEKSVLNEVTVHHLHALRVENVFDVRVGLVGQTREPASHLKSICTETFGTDRIMESLESRFEEMSICSRGDVVVFPSISGQGLSCGEILSNLDIAGVPVSVVDEFIPLETHTDQQYCKWKACGHSQFIATDAFIATVIWTRSDDVITTLLPRRG